MCIFCAFVAFTVGTRWKILMIAGIGLEGHSRHSLANAVARVRDMDCSGVLGLSDQDVDSLYGLLVDRGDICALFAA